MTDEIEFGSSEHIAGLSREALEQDFAWVVDRKREIEAICDRLDAENADLKKRLETIYIADPVQHGQHVLNEIDRLRRDLNDYHGHLKAHSDLQVHCDRQRERIACLEGLYAKVKAERDETAMAFSKEHDRAEFLMRENAKLREELEFEREDNESIRALFDAVAPRCGKPDCPSLVEYVEKLRELVRDMWSWLLVPTVGGATLHDLQGRMRELGIEEGR